ncbi:MAG: ABC transporter substrate-binding protein [Christensenellales bacterium]|jgi:multiple sugar transport system substrate-binding protein|nr:extracellular solute-binding protein [Clostridiales bacterium]
MKRLLALLLAALLMVSVISVSTAAEPVTLDVIICDYGPNTQNWFLGNGMDGSNFVKKFEEANPDIKLNLEVISWNDVHTVVSTRISNNMAPDILNIDTFAQYATEDLLIPVSDYCPEELFDDFFPSFIEQSVIDGVCWAVPDLASARALYYNIDLLTEAGVENPPETWAELEDVCQAIIDFYGGEVYPWGMDLTTDEGQAAFAYYAWGNNGGFVDEEGNWNVNRKENVEAVEFAIGLYNKGYTNPNPATQTRYDNQDMFASGKTAMVIAPQNMPTYIKDKGGDINFGVADIPHNEGATSGSVGVMDRIMAFKPRTELNEEQTKARNEAIGKFLTFFYEKENYVGWVSMEDFLPAVNSAVAALVEINPDFEAWLAVLGNARFYPTAKPEWNDVKQGVIAVQQEALVGGDIQAGLDALQEKITK